MTWNAKDQQLPNKQE